jgi:two-component system, OmpR family, alkaline phosphatase synthesis response regulator PhoP
VESRAQKGRRILVIDDDPLMHQLARTVLGRGGYEILSATSGRGGIEISVLELPRAIILDYVMQDMDGLETLRQLKSSEALKDIPVLMMTGTLDSSMCEQFVSAGAAACLPKPFLAADLLNLVQRLAPGPAGAVPDSCDALEASGQAPSVSPTSSD